MINALQIESAGNQILLTLINNKFLSLACPPNYYLSGMESVHKNGMEDRFGNFAAVVCPTTSWTWKSCHWYSNDKAMQTKFLFLQVPFLNDQFFKVVLFIN